jgi:hypothetical protein
MENKLDDKFWREIKEKFVGEFEEFTEWIEKYKEKNHWKHFFNPNFMMEGMMWRGVNFFDLPDAMQIGIFIQYVAESNSRYVIELPMIESVKDFDKMKDVIYDFFFHENDNVRQEHLEAKYMDNGIDDVEFEN